MEKGDKIRVYYRHDTAPYSDNRSNHTVWLDGHFLSSDSRAIYVGCDKDKNIEMVPWLVVARITIFAKK